MRRATVLSLAVVVGVTGAVVVAPPADALSATEAAQAGLLVIGDMPGPRMDAATDSLLRRKNLGGIILFGRNVTGGPQLHSLVAAIHRDHGLVTVDQEGGTVRRLKPQGPAPSARTAGKGTPASVEALMRAAGADLHRTGIDIDFAPDADLDLGGFIGSRSYGSDWRKVRDDVAAAVRGLQAGGTLATTKHFPGLGTVRTNTDNGPVLAGRVTGPQLQPFRAAAQAGVALTMVGNATYPGIGHGPASLQKAAYDLLRGPTIGFTGVAVTDSLGAAALSSYGEQTAAVDAIRAGADMVIVTGGPGAVGSVVDRLVAAVRKGVVPAARFRAALARVRELRSRCSLG